MHVAFIFWRGSGERFSSFLFRPAVFDIKPRETIVENFKLLLLVKMPLPIGVPKMWWEQIFVLYINTVMGQIRIPVEHLLLQVVCYICSSNVHIFCYTSIFGVHHLFISLIKTSAFREREWFLMYFSVIRG